MTAAEDGGRTVLVGVQIDGNGREVLDWALARVARPGDSVLAVHVCRHGGGGGAVQLESFLGEYQGFANLKQVALVGRISKGISIRKTLVKEAKLCSANAVVVGVNGSTPFGGTVSVAKYCAKKLPPATSIIAIRHGKVVFETETLKSAATPELATKPNLGNLLGNCREENKLESITGLVRKLPEKTTPGWPLLRKASMANCRSPGETDARKMTVVQWVMQLPDRSGSSPSNFRSELQSVLEKNSSTCRWFTDAELQSCTDHFSPENLIGKGGSGRVYRGSLPGGDLVAVKILNSSPEATRDFISEVDIVTSLHHSNVVSLLGIGVKDDALVSVYSHFSRGSLEENLHGSRCEQALSWERRFSIAVSMADALNYLHRASPRAVIHRDVKSSNILLSDDFHAQLSDFGLALWAPTSNSFAIQGDVVGTFGYLAPEYFMYGKISDKVDVYAFGVVLLELVTGKRPISSDTCKTGQGSLVMWATLAMERGELQTLLDPNLEENYDEEQVRRVVEAASLCLRRSARLRPPIGEILRLLKGEDIDLEARGTAAEVAEEQDEEVYPPSSVASHLGLALLDVDDAASFSSAAPSCYQASLEEYLKGRWSRSSSFD